ncbi:hypothetical protein [Maribacter sp. ACAM166]|uniref:hypothetical protein n=1 Tax=Maribacter sp. ACAM166 TaxID=2508996 RepID=UPI0010FF37F8|nr:hypothetical protein [Maribacter sp. ACAM166]TLP74280.1 hypothetical protein ES765_16440 [Maribacter sp. ACAM166]
MKTHILFLLTLIYFQPCIAQQSQTDLPKVENYTKVELEIMMQPFGSENPISVGKITADGTIHFNWNTDISSVQDTDLYLSSIKRAVGMNFCNDKEIEQSNEEAKAVNIDYLFLYKYGQAVGSIHAKTESDIGENRHSSLILGSTLSWVYSDSDALFNAKCTVNFENENIYKFNEVTSYTIQLKKGWNMMLNTLTEKEDWTNGTEKGSLPKTMTKTSITKIPSTINWYLKYWANDELLEIKQQLLKLKPINKEHYGNWLPKKLGNLKRTGYEVGQTIENMPTLNNVNLLFEKGSKTIDLTIVDCVSNKDAVSMYTSMKGMVSRDWKDKTETGYNSATEMDGKRVMTEYNEKEVKTILSYNANERFVIKAEANQITPEELWGYLKTLNLEALIKE